MATLDEARQQLSRALALKETGKVDEAATFFATAENMLIQLLEQNDQDVQAHTVYARLLREQGRYDEAKRQYQRAIDIDRTDGNLIAEYNEYLTELGGTPPPLPPPPKLPQTPTKPVPPNLAEARWRLGVWKMGKDDPEGAAADFDKALQIDPNYVPALVDKSTLLLKQKRYSEVEPLLARLQTVDVGAVDKCLADCAGDQDELLWLRGLLYQRQGELEKAGDHFRQALSKHPDREDWIQTYIDLLHQQNRVPDAKNWLHEAVMQAESTPDEHPSRFILYREYARILCEQDDVEVASRYLKMALALRSDDQVALNLQQSLQPRLDEWEQAMGYMLLAETRPIDQADYYYKLALQHYPKHLPALQSYANFLQRQERYGEAVRKWVEVMPYLPEETRKHLEEILKAQGENTATLNGLAQVLEQVGRNDEAEAYLKRSLALDPHKVETLRQLANLIEKCGRPREAEHLLADNKKVVETDALLCLKYAELLGKRREYEEAAPFFRKAHKLAVNNQELLAQVNPAVEQANVEIEKFDNATIVMLQGEQAEKAGRLEAAESFYRRAIEIYPEHLPTLEHLIELLEKSGRTVQASLFAVEIAKIDPERAIAHYENSPAAIRNTAEGRTAYAFLLQNLNQVEQARTQYWEALQVQPAFIPALSHYCRLLTDEKNLCEASTALERALKHDSTTAHVQYLYGELLIRRHRYEDAKSYLERACKLEPANQKYKELLDAHADQFRQVDSAGAQWALAKQKIESDPIRAEELFIKSHAVCQEYVPTFRDYGAFLLKQGRLEEARTMLQRAIELDPCEGEASTLLSSLNRADQGTESIASNSENP